MGDFWGADTEALTDLYRTFERRSDDLQDMATRLDVWVVRQAHDDWEGPTPRPSSTAGRRSATR